MTLCVWFQSAEVVCRLERSIRTQKTRKQPLSFPSCEPNKGRGKEALLSGHCTAQRDAHPDNALVRRDKRAEKV